VAILDTFYLLFKSDAKELDKGLDESRKKAKDAAKEIGKADEAAYKLGESIGKSLRNLAGVVAGTLAVHALTESFMGAVDVADKLNESADRLGVNIETLSAWGDLTKKNGGSAEAFIGSIESLNRAMSTMEVTGKSRVAPFFKELGIDLESTANKGKTAMDFLPEIAASFETMDKQKSVAIGQKLGLDMGTIMTLQQGKRAVEELLAREKELGVVTKAQGEAADNFGDQMDDTRHALRSMWLEISTAVLPVMTWFAKKVEELFTFFRENKHLIIGVFIAVGAAIAVFAIPPLLSMAAAALAALAPFLLIGAAIAALAVLFGLLYDDVVNFIEGNDSLIGQFLNEYPQIAAILEGIGDVFKWLASVVSDVGQILWTAFVMVFQAAGTVIGGIIGFWVEKLSGVSVVFEALGALVSGIFTYWIDLIGKFLDKFGGIVGIAKAVGGAISGALGAAKTAMGIGEGATPGPRQESGATGPYGVGGAIPGLAEGKQQLGGISGSAIGTQSAAATGARTSNKTTTVNVGEVKVQTQATDAAGISKSIGDTMGAQLRQAASNYDDGVAA
jgi:hypothetical protein